MDALRLEEVTKIYTLKDREVIAANNVSFVVAGHTMATLEGPSGSGKTTLLSLIGGLDYPTEGKIFYGDRDMTALSLTELAEIRRQKVGFIFQDYLLFNELTVLDNVALALHIALGTRDPSIERRAKDWIERVGMAHRLDHRPAQLSGGEKQRVGVARALVKHPELLIADEPTSNLDDKNREMIFQILADYQQQNDAILLIASHDHIFTGNSQQRLRFDNGRLKSEG